MLPYATVRSSDSAAPKSVELNTALLLLPCQTMAATHGWTTGVVRGHCALDLDVTGEGRGLADSWCWTVGRRLAGFHGAWP
jgi:hypothetical protein